MQWRCDGRVYYNSYARCLFIPCSFVLTFIGTTRLRISYLSLLLGFPHLLACSFAVSMIVLSFHSLVAFVLNSQEIVIIRNDSINIFNLINVCITYVFFLFAKMRFSASTTHTRLRWYVVRSSAARGKYSNAHTFTNISNRMLWFILFYVISFWTFHTSC